MRTTKTLLTLLLVVFGEFGIEPFANGKLTIVGCIELSFSRTIIVFINSIKIRNHRIIHWNYIIFQCWVKGGNGGKKIIVDSHETCKKISSGIYVDADEQTQQDVKNKYPKVGVE